MPRIRIRDLNPQQGNRKTLLWNKLMNLNLLVYTIKQPNNQTFILITSDEVVDRMLSNQIKEKLKSDNFEIFTPPEYNANRTLVLRNIDSLITGIESEELKNDLERRNEWLKVSEVIKIPNAPKILKIRAETTDMVKRAEEKGILIWNQSIPPNNVQKEIYIFLNICYKCYSFEHRTEDCLTPNIIICSECAAPSHTFKDCTSQVKKCINCQGDHRTLAAKCPIRKNLLKEKEKTIRERSRSRSRSRQRTYAQATAASIETKKQTVTGLSREDQVKIYSSITYAHMVEGILPGSFNTTIKEMYRLNDLPAVRFPNYIPSPNIDQDRVQEEINKMINAFEQAQKEEAKEDKEESEEEASRKRTITPSPKEQRQTKSRREEAEPEMETEEQAIALPTKHHGSTYSVYSDVLAIKPKESQTQSAQSKPADPRTAAKKTIEVYQKHAQQMKFCFIKSKDTIIKKKEDPREISKLIKEGKLKYVYTNSEYSETDCRMAWEKGYVNLRDVEIRNVSPEFYKEIEYNGKLVERRTSLTGTVKKK